jgi:hypothetical protein
LGTAAFVVLKLGAGAFQVTVVKQPLQTPGQLLCAATNKGDDLMRTQKPVPVNELENGVVTMCQFDGRNRGDTLKARKPRHPTRMWLPRKTGETLGFA